MQLDNTAFKAKYGLAGSQFPNNTTGLITELIMRQFGEDMADSFANILSGLYLDLVEPLRSILLERLKGCFMGTPHLVLIRLSP
jgi:hypothetical protein